jgi:hypothetical protein
MFVLASLGIALVAVSLIAVVRKPSFDGPGMLVARQTSQVWRSPEVKDGRKPPNRAEVRFTFKNRGSTDVNVLSVSSGCGCATPTIHPRCIRPGQEGVMNVSAMPPTLGERTVSFVIKTDSKRTPELPFQLRMISSREPPFILSVKGDLTFAGNFKLDETRDFRVHTVVTKQHGEQPIISADLPFLKIGLANMVTQDYDKPDTLQCSYRYSVRLTKIPVDETVTGTVTITDPWDPSLVRQLPVYIHVAQDLVVSPATLTLNLRSPTDTETTTTFLVKRNSDRGTIHIDEVTKTTPRFVIHESDLSSDGRVKVVSVRLAPDTAVSGGDHELIVRTDSGTRRVVPIHVKVGANR